MLFPCVQSIGEQMAEQEGRLWAPAAPPQAAGMGRRWAGSGAVRGSRVGTEHSRSWSGATNENLTVCFCSFLRLGCSGQERLWGKGEADTR